MEGYEFYKSKKWISPSSASKFRRCPRYYFYSSGCNMEAQGGSAPLTFGKAIHASLPYAFKGDMTKAMETFCSVWNDSLQDDKRNVMRAQAMLENFRDCHANDNSIYKPMLAPENRLKTEEHMSEYEVPFAVDINRDIPLVGLVDCLATHRDTGKVWPVEYKTTSQLGTMFLESFNMSPQVRIYAMAMKILMGIEIEGVFLEGLLVAKVSCNTMAIPIYIKPFYFEETLHWIQKVLDDIRTCEKEENFPKNFSGCNSYDMFGSPGYTCPFYPLCSTTDKWTDLKEVYEIKEDRDSPF